MVGKCFFRYFLFLWYVVSGFNIANPLNNYVDLKVPMHKLFFVISNLHH